MTSTTDQINFVGLIPKSAYGTCLAVGLVLCGLYIYDQFDSLRYQAAKFLAQRIGYFSNDEGKQMKELNFNSRFLRFSHGHGVSEKGAAIAGDEPYITWNDGKPEVVLSRPEHAKDFYGRATKGLHLLSIAGDNPLTFEGHEKPPHMGMGPYFDRVLGYSVGVLNGDKWKTMRRVFDPHLAHQMAMDFRPSFSREVAAWMEALPSTWGKTADGPPDSGFVVDASTACKILPFKLVALALYKDALSDSAFEELLELNALHEKLMFKVFFGSSERSRLFTLLPSQAKRQMDEFERKWRAFNLKMVQSAEMDNLSYPVAKMYPSVLNGSITEREFLHTIDEILFANIDVTSSVLAFLLINLARSVVAQTDLRAEILEHTADSEAYIQKTDTLLEYTCMESIRLCPAAWFSLPEHATSDMTVGGYLVPAGTPCIMDWWRLNTQSPVWNTETVSGTTFWPRRFESVTPQEYRWSFLRFGLGSRKCIGKNFSAVIMKTFLVAVLKEWKLQTVGLTREEELEMVETRKDRFTVTPDQRVAFARV